MLRKGLATSAPQEVMAEPDAPDLQTHPNNNGAVLLKQMTITPISAEDGSAYQMSNCAQTGGHSGIACRLAGQNLF